MAEPLTDREQTIHDLAYEAGVEWQKARHKALVDEIMGDTPEPREPLPYPEIYDEHPSAQPLTAEELHAIALAAEVGKQRLRRDARRILEVEEHARTWRTPTDVGSLKTWLSQPETRPRWRFDGILGAGHNLVAVASRKAGKTTLVDNLARSYVDGGPFLGRFDVTTTGRSVAILNYEVEAEQYRRWLRESGIEATDRVYVLNLRGLSLPLASDQVAEWVAGWLRERDVGMWIVDPWSRAYVGSVDNGNDEAQVGRFLARLDEIKQAGNVDELAMPVHTPKGRVDPGAESAIGSQRLEAWPDVMVYLVREDKQRFLRAEGRDVDVPESLLAYDPKTRALTLDTSSGDREQVRAKTDLHRLLGWLREHPDARGSDIEGALGWDARRRKRVVDAAVADGSVTRRPGPHNSQLHRRAVDDGGES